MTVERPLFYALLGQCLCRGADSRRQARRLRLIGLHVAGLGSRRRPPPGDLDAGHSGPITAVALTADGKRAVSGSDDHTLRVWDLESNHPPRVLEGHSGPVRAVALTTGGKRSVSGSETTRWGSGIWRAAGAAWHLLVTTPSNGCAWGAGWIAARDARHQLHPFAWEE
jgi:hypothetical protein